MHHQSGMDAFSALSSTVAEMIFVVMPSPSSAFLQAEAERKAKPKKVRAKAKLALGKPGKGALLHTRYPLAARLQEHSTL